MCLLTFASRSEGQDVDKSKMVSKSRGNQWEVLEKVERCERNMILL